MAPARQAVLSVLGLLAQAERYSMEMDAVLDVQRNAGRAPGDNLVVVKGEGFSSDGWLGGSWGASQLDNGDWGFVGETSSGLVRVHMADPSKGDQRVKEADLESKFKLLKKPEPGKRAGNWWEDCGTAGQLDDTGADEDSKKALADFLEICQGLQELQVAEDAEELKHKGAAAAEAEQQKSQCDVKCGDTTIEVDSINRFKHINDEMVAWKVETEITEKYLNKCSSHCYVKPHESKAAKCSLLYGQVATGCLLEKRPEIRGGGTVHQCYTVCCYKVRSC